MSPLLVEYSRLEKLQPDRHLGLVQGPRPLRMLGARHMPFRMRHQSHDVAVRVADAGDGVHRAVRIGALITEYDLPILLERSERLRILGHKLAFAMRDGKIPLQIGRGKPR